jgi:hypothetical protein
MKIINLDKGLRKVITSTFSRVSCCLAFKSILCFLFFTFVSASKAESFSTLSDHAVLNNYVIVDAGNVKKLDSSVGVNSGSERLQLNGRCFDTSGPLGFWGYDDRAGLLLRSQTKSMKVAFFASDINTIKVDVVVVQPVSCSFQSSGARSAEEVIEDIRRQNENRNRRIEQLERQFGER